MTRLLMIESDRVWGQSLAQALTDRLYQVDWVHQGWQGLRCALASEQAYDAVIVDLYVVGLNGMDLCRKIRQQSTVPLIMMSQQAAISFCIQALQAGADDYLVKPFAVEELMARLMAVFRRIEFERQHEALDPRLTFKDLVLETGRQGVRRQGQWIPLSPREFDLLHQLMLHVDQLCSRQMLLEEVWGSQTSGRSNVVDVYIRYLRQKIDFNRASSYIQTVRGQGYLLAEGQPAPYLIR